MVPSPAHPLAAALDYARRGWAVLPNHTPNPVRRGQPGECTCMPAARCRKGWPGKHPRFLQDDLAHGFNSASTDLSRITRWFTMWPLANIGIQPRRSGLGVLDIDRRHGGDVSLDHLVAIHGALPPTPSVHRLSVGLVHAYFHLPTDVTLYDIALAPGVELLINKQVIAPPSLHIDGTRYAWLHHPDEVPLAALPAWIIAYALAQHSTTGQQRSLRSKSSAASRGTDAASMRNSSTCCSGFVPGVSSLQNPGAFFASRHCAGLYAPPGYTRAHRDWTTLSLHLARP